jgi:hypothetical protein
MNATLPGKAPRPKGETAANPGLEEVQVPCAEEPAEKDDGNGKGPAPAGTGAPDRCIAWGRRGTGGLEAYQPLDTGIGLESD